MRSHRPRHGQGTEHRQESHEGSHGVSIAPRLLQPGRRIEQIDWFRLAPDTRNDPTQHSVDSMVSFDHLRFTRLEQVNSKRKKGGFGGVVKPENPQVHAQKLLDQLVGVRQRTARCRWVRSALAGEVEGRRDLTRSSRKHPRIVPTHPFPRAFFVRARAGFFSCFAVASKAASIARGFASCRTW